MYGSVLLGTLGFIVASTIGYPIAGVGIYWIGILGFLAVWQGTSFSLFDERERALERRASVITLTLSGLVMIAAGPAEVVLSEVGLYSAPPVFEGALLTISVQAVVFGLTYLWLRYRL